MRPVLASPTMRRAAVRGALLPAVAAALAFAAFFFNDGSSQSRLFWIVAVDGWALRPPQLSSAAVVFLAALGAFVVWQGVSIAWSIQASRSWDYTNRGLVYFAFAVVGVLLGGVSPRRFAYGAAVLLGALFVWALAAKVIPGLYGDYGRLARLRYPLGYWNELGLLAAASVPVALWVVGRARAAGALLLYAGLVVVVLTYSRVGIVLTVVAALVWLALDERRLDAIGPLAVAWIAGAAVAGVALLLPGVSDDGQPHGVRLQDGLVFGAALVVGAVVVAAALRYVVTRAVDRRVVRAAAALLAAVVLAALGPAGRATSSATAGTSSPIASARRSRTRGVTSSRSAPATAGAGGRRRGTRSPIIPCRAPERERSGSRTGSSATRRSRSSSRTRRPCRTSVRPGSSASSSSRSRSLPPRSRSCIASARLPRRRSLSVRRSASSIRSWTSIGITSASRGRSSSRWGCSFPGRVGPAAAGCPPPRPGSAR